MVDLKVPHCNVDVGVVDRKVPEAVGQRHRHKILISLVEGGEKSCCTCGTHFRKYLCGALHNNEVKTLNLPGF